MKNVYTYITHPLRGGAAGVVVVFSVLAFFAMHAGLLGLPLGLILFSWFFKYAYILFDSIVRGVTDPPALDIQTMNPVDEQRPLAQLVILGFLTAAFVWVAPHLPNALTLLLGIVVMLVLPASVAVLGLEGNVLKAVYPVALIRMISGLGLWYAVTLVALAGYALLFFALGRLQLWLIVDTLLAMFAVLSIFSLLAGALYERRLELGLDTWHSPERTAERQRLAEVEASERRVADAYGLVRVGAHAKASAQLQGWLDEQGGHPEDYRWLCERLEPWSDRRYVDRLTRQYVDKLLSLKRMGEALDVVVHRLRLDPTFRPQSAQATLEVARLAAQGGGSKRVARTLLADFDVRFAGDPLVLAAAALARQLGE